MTPAPTMVPILPPSDSGPPSTPTLPPMPGTTPAPVPGTTPAPAPVVAPAPDPSPTSYSYLGCFGDSNTERVLTGDSLSNPGMTTEVRSVIGMSCASHEVDVALLAMPPHHAKIYGALVPEQV